MKIGFYDASHVEYDASTPLTDPLGGTQSAVCYLAAALARRGHETYIFNARRTPKAALGVRAGRYLGPSEATRYNQLDAVIVPTMPVGRRLRECGVTTTLISWQHQSTKSSNVADVTAPGEREAWDRVVFVSDQQRQDYLARFGVDGAVRLNAPSPPFTAGTERAPYFFETGAGPSFAYSSAPGRGMDFLLMAFPTIRAAIPDATLRIYSDQALYQVPPERDDYTVYYEVAKALPGVEHVGSLPQAKLAEALRQTDYWAYPTVFIETSCIAMMEAGAAGCGLITASVGALSETAAGHATLVDPLPGKAGWSKAYAAAVVDRVRRDRADPAAARRRLDEQTRHFRAMTWDVRAEEWDALIQSLRSAGR